MMNILNQNKVFFFNYFENKRLGTHCTNVLQCVRIESKYFEKRDMTALLTTLADTPEQNEVLTTAVIEGRILL